MKYSTYAEATKANLPPNLEAGTILNRITRIEPNTFEFEGSTKQGMRVFADDKEFRTSSAVIMKQLKEFFDKNPNEVLENVKVVAPRGKKYLTLESA